MDRAQTRLLVVLSVLVVGVAGVLYAQGEPEDESDPDATALVWQVEEDAIVRVEVRRKDGEGVVLEEKDEVWQVVAPFQDRADDTTVRELVRTLAELDRGVPVQASADRAADFGLGEPPVARVTVTLADGATHTVDVGAAAPVGFRTYVRAKDGSIAAVDGDANRIVDEDPDRYRDRKVFRFDPAQVRSVVLRSPDGTLDVSGQGKDWWLAGFGRADPDRVDELVVGLLDLRYDHVGTGQHVAEPRFEVTVRLEDGAVHALKVGEPGDMGVLCETGDGRSGSVYPALLEQLGRGPTDLAVRTAFQVAPDAADRVRIEGLADLDAARNGPDWTAPGRDPGVVADAIEALARVPASWEEGLPAPEPVAGRVIVTEGERTWTVELGPVLAEGHRLARDTAGGAPFRIPASSLDEALMGLR